MDCATLRGLPIQAELNEFRVVFTQVLNSDMDEPKQDTSVRVIHWIGHKVVSLLCFPVNITGLGIGLGGMALSACTLGALKVFIYSASLGRWEPRFSTGFSYMADTAAYSAYHLLQNTYEVVLDVKDLVYEIFHSIYKVSVKFGLEPIVTVAFSLLKKAYKFADKRLGIGFNKACFYEIPGKYEAICPFSFIDGPTQQTRGFFEDRSVALILNHGILSAFNIPANVIAVIGLSILASGFQFLLISKTLLCAVTTIDLPLPTYAVACFKASAYAVSSLALDLFQNISDMALLIYKAAAMLQVTQAIITIAQLLSHIPKLIVS
jgi:hypothetical protein